MRNLHLHDTYMYQNKLSGIISEDLMKQSTDFIKEHKEARHKTVMERQIKKYNKLWAEKYESSRYMYSTNSSRYMYSTDSGNGTNGTGGHSNQDTADTKC